MSYEFSEEEEKIVFHVSILGVIISVLLIVIGIIAYLDALVDEVSGMKLVISLIQGFTLLIIGIIFVSPVLAFRRVAQTEGRDIEEMIGGLGIFGQYLQVTIILIGISLVLGIVGVFL
ncbi:MAG: hypothetical protein ACXAE3_10215 [Candidatus Kariarchaeaceae archaeon]|jgi:hypothetical protein